MARVSSQDRAEPNLTPILDMVFQLITFFMLVINFKTASMDLSLRLPAIGSARPVDVKGQDLVVLNIDRQGALRIFGGREADVAGCIALEAQASLMTARKLNPDLKLGDELPTMVVIRADRKTPFKHLDTVITACQRNGFRSFSLKALNRRDIAGEE
jgi:biopolymer transport protein ExbD